MEPWAQTDSIDLPREEIRFYHQPTDARDPLVLPIPHCRCWWTGSRARQGDGALHITLADRLTSDDLAAAEGRRTFSSSKRKVIQRCPGHVIAVHLRSQTAPWANTRNQPSLAAGQPTWSPGLLLDKFSKYCATVHGTAPAATAISLRYTGSWPCAILLPVAIRPHGAAGQRQASQAREEAAPTLIGTLKRPSVRQSPTTPAASFTLHPEIGDRLDAGR